jgi:hypothetical protein
MNSLKKTARGAGILYGILVVFKIFSGLIVDLKIYVPGDAVTTTSNILAFERLFRLAVVSNLVSEILFLFFGPCAIQPVKSVNKGQSRLMVIPIVASVPVVVLNSLI